MEGRGRSLAHRWVEERGKARIRDDGGGTGARLLTDPTGVIIWNTDVRGTAHHNTIVQHGQGHVYVCALAASSQYCSVYAAVFNAGPSR